jgi:hypothetical protein
VPAYGEHGARAVGARDDVVFLSEGELSFNNEEVAVLRFKN